MKAEIQKIGDKLAVLIPDTFIKDFEITKDLDIRLENGRIIIAPIKSKKDRPERFVNFVMDFCIKEKKAGLAALKNADNPQKRDKSDPYLAPFHVFNDFDSENEYAVYATVAAAIAKADVKENGNVGIGRAIARCYATSTTGDKKELDTQSVNKLRRLLACDSPEEVCRVLRPLFSLINAKGLSKTIDYISLLRDLDNFHLDWSKERTKQYWARDFYGRLRDKDDDKDGENE